MTLRLVTLLLGSALWLSSLSAQGEPQPVQITLERTACFGTCPIYSITISGDGRVAFTGKQHVRVVGSASATVSPESVAGLVEAFERIGYFRLKDRYDRIERPDGTAAFVTDLPTTTTSIRIGSRFKQVVDYVGSPEGLRDLELRIDALAGAERWISVTPDVVRQLQRGGWNAAGTDGAEYLMKAIYRRDPETVQSLLEANADPNDERSLPLAAAQDPRVIRLLVGAGADVHRLTSWGETILNVAVRSGRADTVRAMLAAGARPSQQSQQGQTALQVAEQLAASPPPQFPGDSAAPREYAQIIALLRAASPR
jgi:hypothetical protein